MVFVFYVAFMLGKYKLLHSYDFVLK